MSNPPLKVEESNKNGVFVYSVLGYFNDVEGKQTHKMVDAQLQRGNRKFIIDFSVCNLINSPGAAWIFDIVQHVIDDFHGRIVVCGADKLRREVFQMCGIFPLAESAQTVEEAFSIVLREAV